MTFLGSRAMERATSVGIRVAVGLGVLALINSVLAREAERRNPPKGLPRNNCFKVVVGWVRWSSSIPRGIRCG
jgi:hypothetical protein